LEVIDYLRTTQDDDALDIRLDCWLLLIVVASASKDTETRSFSVVIGKIFGVAVVLAFGRSAIDVVGVKANAFARLASSWISKHEHAIRHSEDVVHRWSPR
jgi:hypothetical protein